MTTKTTATPTKTQRKITLAQYPGQTAKGGKVVTVKLIIEPDGTSWKGCDCKSWIYQRRPTTSRECSHTRQTK